MRKLFLILIVVTLGIASWSCSENYDDTALWKEINDLKAQLEKLNTNLAKVQTTVSQLESGKYVTNYAKTENGCTLTFNDGTIVSVENGKNGEAGADAPIIGLKENNGVYYWTLTTNGEESWLMTPAPNSKMIPVSGKTPVMGVDAEGYWTVDGNQIKDDNGDPIKAGVDASASIFTASEETADDVTLTLASGDKIVLPKAGKLTINLANPSAEFAYGQQQTFTVTMKGVEKTTITKPDGWKVELTANILTVTAPVKENVYAEKSGVIAIIGITANSSCMAELKVEIGSPVISYSIDGGEWTLSTPTAAFASLAIKTQFGAVITGTQLQTYDALSTNYTLDLGEAAYESTDFPDIYKGNTNLASIILPNNIEKLGYEAFKSATMVSSILLPNSLKEIEDYAFAGTDALTSLNIPEGVTKLGKCMFYFFPMMGYGESASSLKEVTIPSTVTDWQIGPITTGSYWFNGCESLEKIICKVAIPVEVSGGNWGDFGKVPENCVIYVPDPSVTAYKATEVWEDFTIKGLSELQ